jgi:hypothetical protein
MATRIKTDKEWQAFLKSQREIDKVAGNKSPILKKLKPKPGPMAKMGKKGRETPGGRASVTGRNTTPPVPMNSPIRKRIKKR